VNDGTVMVDSNIDDMFEKMSEARDRYQAKAMSIPGVFGTSIGIRQTAGKLVTEPAIIFHVETKRPLQEIPAGERIPKELEDFPTDVVGKEVSVATTATALNDERDYRPLEGGCQITEGRSSTNNKGTLGCAVKYVGNDRPDDTLYKGRIYILSASHVMLGVGNSIYQPYKFSEHIGNVRASVLNDKVDAAIADIAHDEGAKPTIIEIGLVKGAYTVTDRDIRGIYRVKKRGRTTGLTSGYIGSMGFKATAGIGREQAATQGLMTIISRDSDNNVVNFAGPGDSGAVVVNDKNQVVGLLTQMVVAGDLSCCYAIPIDTVLKALDIEIFV
jgi:hypothetical protein